MIKLIMRTRYELIYQNSKNSHFGRWALARAGDFWGRWTWRGCASTGGPDTPT